MGGVSLCMRTPVVALLVALAGGGALSLACGAHEELTPPIAVQPGAAARAMLLLGHGGPNDPIPRRALAEDAGEGPAPSGASLGSIAFSCLEARGAVRALGLVPCAVTITGIRETSVPEAELVSENGKIAVALAPGSYRVTAARGPEYARVTWEAEVLAGKRTWGPNEGATILRRVVDTRGYLAVDLRALVPAADAGRPDNVRDTVFDDAADGVEIVLGDAPLFARLAPIVQAAKVEDLIALSDAQDLDAQNAWSGRAAFLSRVASGRPVTAVAPPPARTYVRVDDDGPLVTWSPAREADLVRGICERRDVVLTTGPFLRVTANGAPIGGVARVTADGDVEVKVHVECAPWVAVDRVSIVRSSGVSVAPQSVSLRPTPSDGRAADATFHLHALADDAFVVLADASAASADAAVDSASSTRAMTGALWIDADGDGVSLGRKVP